MVPLRLLPLLAAVFVAGCDTTGIDLPPEPEADAPAWDEMLAAVNAVRAQGATCGEDAMGPAPPLAWDGRLEAAAAHHAADMARHAYIDHTGRDGSDPGDRARRAGYDWRRIGENLARYQQTVDGVVEAWLESPGHCRQLLDPRYVEMGAAEEGYYWAQVFGVPR